MKKNPMPHGMGPNLGGKRENQKLWRIPMATELKLSPGLDTL